MTKPRLYLSGKMGVIGGAEYEQHCEYFNRHAERLRELGYHVYNPAEHEDEGATRHGYLAKDISLICSDLIDAVAVLPNWRDSRGATMEVYVCGEIGKRVYNSAKLITFPESDILLHEIDTRVEVNAYDRPTSPCERGKALMDGDRWATYGDPSLKTNRTAAYWTVYLSSKLQAGKTIDCNDVCDLMCLEKISRDGHIHTFQNAEDVCGYMEIKSHIWNSNERGAEVLARMIENAMSQQEAQDAESQENPGDI